MLSSHYHHHKSKTFSQLTQCPFTGTLLLFFNPILKLPEGKYIKPRLQQPNTARWDNLVLKTKFRSSIQILPRSVFLLKLSGALMDKVPIQVLKNLNTKLGRISLPSISQLLSLRMPLLVTLLWKSVSTVSRLPLRGLKVRSRRVLILKENPYSAENLSLPQQICSPNTPEGAVYHGQNWPAKTWGRDDPPSTTSRGL